MAFVFFHSKLAGFLISGVLSSSVMKESAGCFSIGVEVGGDLFIEDFGIFQSNLLDKLTGFLTSKVLSSGMKDSALRALLGFAGTEHCARTVWCFFLINGDLFREGFGIIQSKLLGGLAGIFTSGREEAAWKALLEVSMTVVGGPEMS